MNNNNFKKWAPSNKQRRFQKWAPSNKQHRFKKWAPSNKQHRFKSEPHLISNTGFKNEPHLISNTGFKNEPHLISNTGFKNEPHLKKNSGFQKNLPDVSFQNVTFELQDETTEKVVHMCRFILIHKYIHFATYAVIIFRKFRRKSNLSQFGIEYSCYVT